jgi:transposase-like protein
VHKTANMLNKLPKSQQSKAKRALQETWMAETKKDALAAFDVFVETSRVKYNRAVGSPSRSGNLASTTQVSRDAESPQGG